jgi:hypothetical protein
MPTLTIGENKISVGDDFMKMSPEQQHATVEEIAKALPNISPAQEKPAPDSFGSRVETGFMDPIYGDAQLMAHLNEAPPKKNETEGQKRIRERQQAGREGIDKTIQKREADYKPPEGFDAGRLVGNALQPLNYLGAMVGGPITGAMTAGALTGLTQPVKDTKDFGTTKTEQGVVGGVVGGVLGAAGKAAGYGVRSLGEYLAREYPENVMTQAVHKILKRMGQDEKAGGPTAKDAIDLINEAAKEGKPTTLADVGGENTKALAGNVSRQPGPSRNITKSFLETRDAGAPGGMVGPRTPQQMSAQERLSGDIAKYVNGGPSMHKTTEAMLMARSAASKPVYDEMRALEGIWSPRLQQFIDDPALKSGMARGYELERLQSLAENRPFDPTQLGVDLDQQGNIKLLKSPNMRVLDMGKQGLDAMIADERNELTGRLTARGVWLDRVRQAYVNELDTLDKSGIYRLARETWSGPTKSLDAMRMGRSVFNNSPEQNAAEFSKLAPGDQEFARLGVADMLRERLAKTGLSGDEAKSLVKNPWMRDQLKPYFKTPEDFDSFVDAVTKESKMFGTKFDVLGGSQTAKRAAEDESTENLLSAGGADLAMQAGTGRWHSAARTALRMWRDRQDRRGNPKLNEQISRILFQTPIDQESEVAQRLTGTYKGLTSVNRLSGTADVVSQGGSALTPLTSGAISQSVGQ